MKQIISLIVLGAALPVLAATTTRSANKHAYGANMGWVNFEQTLGQPKVGLLTSASMSFLAA